MPARSRKQHRSPSADQIRAAEEVIANWKDVFDRLDRLRARRDGAARRRVNELYVALARIHVHHGGVRRWLEPQSVAERQLVAFRVTYRLLPFLRDYLDHGMSAADLERDEPGIFDLLTAVTRSRKDQVVKTMSAAATSYLQFGDGPWNAALSALQDLSIAGWSRSSLVRNLSKTKSSSTTDDGEIATPRRKRAASSRQGGSARGNSPAPDD